MDVRIYLFSSCELRYVALQHICGESRVFSLVGRASELPESLEALVITKPDLVIIDMESLAASRSKVMEVVLEYLHEVARVLILADHLDVSYACSAIANGACGYVLTSAPLDEFLQALRVVAAGGIWLGRDLVRTIADRFTESHQDEADTISKAARLLSQRERQILNCVARGETSKEIAKELFLSESSVRTYWYRVLGKLNALNKAEAVARAARLGLLDSAPDEEETIMATSPRLRALLHGVEV